MDEIFPVEKNKVYKILVDKQCVTGYDAKYGSNRLELKKLRDTNYFCTKVELIQGDLVCKDNKWYGKVIRTSDFDVHDLSFYLYRSAVINKLDKRSQIYLSRKFKKSKDYRREIYFYFTEDVPIVLKDGIRIYADESKMVFNRTFNKLDNSEYEKFMTYVLYKEKKFEEKFLVKLINEYI